MVPGVSVVPSTSPSEPMSMRISPGSLLGLPLGRRRRQVVSRSIDGWDCGSPTSVIMDGRDAMILD